MDKGEDVGDWYLLLFSPCFQPFNPFPHNGTF